MYQKYINYLKENLDEHRFKHSINVSKKCAELAEKYNYDIEKAYLAGILHDVCKNESKENMLQIFSEFDIILDNIQKEAFSLWHSIAGAVFIQRKFGIDDVEIIDAIRYHTTARESMTKLDKILYLADFISSERDFDGVNELRKFADIDLDKAVFECLKFSINELCMSGRPIHTDTLNAYNYMALERM